MIVIGKGARPGEALHMDVIRRPIAGEATEIHVDEMHGPIHIRVTSGGSIVFSHDCNDPPCHERFMVPIGVGAGGQLQVHVIDAHGGALHDSVHIDAVGP